VYAVQKNKFGTKLRAQDGRKSCHQIFLQFPGLQSAEIVFVAGELTALPRPPGEFKGLLRDREGKGGTRKKGFGRAHPFFVENTPTLYRARSRSFTKKFFVKLLDLALYKFTIQILMQTKIP